LNQYLIGFLAPESTTLTANEPMPKKNKRRNFSKSIFIVGMNGSGTTMLLDCLDNHPEIYGFPRETKILPYILQTSSKYGDLSDDKNFLKLWDNFRSISLFRYVNSGQEIPLPIDWKSTKRSAAGVIDRTLSYFAEKEGKIRWCEKSPMNAQHILLLAQNFPDAKFIHIIRDGRACAASFHRRWRYTPELTVYRWKKIVKEARQQGSSMHDRYFEVRYEDLVENPGKWLKMICIFINVPYNPKIISRKRVQRYSGSKEKKISQKPSYWQNYFRPSQRGRLNRIGGETLRSFGYDVEYLGPEIEPCRLRMIYWRNKDFVYQLARLIKNHWGATIQGRKWDDLSGLIINAIKQKFTNKI
jgi:hypothetical protein